MRRYKVWCICFVSDGQPIWDAVHYARKCDAVGALNFVTGKTRKVLDVRAFYLTEIPKGKRK